MPPPTKKLAWFDEDDEGSDDEESDKEGGAEGGPRKRKREKARKKNDWNKDKRCAYRAVDLAPLIIEKLVAQPNLSTKAIIEELYPAYLQFQPSPVRQVCEQSEARRHQGDRQTGDARAHKDRIPPLASHRAREARLQGGRRGDAPAANGGDHHGDGAR